MNSAKSPARSLTRRRGYFLPADTSVTRTSKLRQAYIVMIGRCNRSGSAIFRDKNLELENLEFQNLPSSVPSLVTSIRLVQRLAGKEMARLINGLSITGPKCFR